MMTAMMLPSAVPLLRLDYVAAQSWPRTALVACGYLSVWIAFGGLVMAGRAGAAALAAGAAVWAL